MSKRRKQERPRTTQDFLVEVQHFEIASGYDGLLRGAPEVAVAVGVYSVGERARTLLRAVFRAEELTSARFPQVIAPSAHERAAVVATDDPAILVVAAGVEDDGGGGLARAYGALERADHISLASMDNGHDVVALQDVTPATWGEAKRAIVLVDGVPLQSRARGDDWVGAAAVCIARVPGTRRHRLHLASDDFVNDWTVVAATKIGWRA